MWRILSSFPSPRRPRGVPSPLSQPFSLLALCMAVFGRIMTNLVLLERVLDIDGCGQPTLDYRWSRLGHYLCPFCATAQNESYLVPKEQNLPLTSRFKSTFAFDSLRKTQSFAPCNILTGGLLRGMGRHYLSSALCSGQSVISLRAKPVLVISVSSRPTLIPGTK